MTNTRCQRFKQLAAIRFGLTSSFTYFLHKYTYKSSPILNGEVWTSEIGGIYELEQKLEDNSIHDEVGETYHQVESQNKT